MTLIWNPLCLQCALGSDKYTRTAQCEHCGNIDHHFLCGTCVGERERNCGHGQSLKDVELYDAPRHYKERDIEVYCCNCGQQDVPLKAYKTDRCNDHEVCDLADD